MVGQAQVRPLQMYFENDSIAVVQGQSFVNFLHISNTSEEIQEIKSITPATNYPGLLLYPKEKIIIKPGEELKLPIKFLATTKFMELPASEITFVISFSEKDTAQKVSFSISKKEERQLALYSFSRENFLNPQQKEATFAFFLENRAYSARSIKLNISSQPQGLPILPAETIISLSGQEKQRVEFTVKAPSEKNFYPDYRIVVKATDLETAENVGILYLNLAILNSQRQLLPSPAPVMGKNFAEVAYNEQGVGFDYIQAKANMEFGLGPALIGRFNLAADYFHTENLYNLYDTYLELEHKKKLLRVGNLYGNDYDYSVYGRGFLAKTAIGQASNLEVFGIENNFRLAGNYFPSDEGSYLAGTKYSFAGGGSAKGKLSYVFDNNTRLNTQSHLGHGSLSWGGPNQSLTLEGGASLERARQSQEQHNGFSGKATLLFQRGRWNIHSLNALASRHYVGLNRGSLNLNQYTGYSLSEKTKIFVQYILSEVQPQYLQPQVEGQYVFPDYYYMSQEGKTGVQWRLGKWNFLLSPQIEKQKINTSYSRDNLLAYRLRGNVGTVLERHSFDLSAEYSILDIDGKPLIDGYQTTFTYRFGGFSLNTSLQWNPNDVIELNNFTGNDTQFFNYNIFANYHFQGFNNKLQGNFAAGWNESELYKNTTQTLAGNLEYSFNNQWAINSSANYTRNKSNLYLGSENDYLQLRFGLRKYFRPSTEIDNFKVSLQLFHDKNNNGIFDKGEAAVPNELLSLNDYNAITDSHGMVIFKNVPAGLYLLKLKNSTSGQLGIDPNFTIARNLKMDVPLIKKNRLFGKLQERRQAYDTRETSVRGVMVYAKNAEGEIFSTVVNQNNEFEFFLNNGEYMLYIENDQYRYPKPQVKVTVKDGDYHEPIIFEYEKKDTVIKVKKF